MTRKVAESSCKLRRNPTTRSPAAENLLLPFSCWRSFRLHCWRKRGLTIGFLPEHSVGASSLPRSILQRPSISPVCYCSDISSHPLEVNLSVVRSLRTGISVLYFYGRCGTLWLFDFCRISFAENVPFEGTRTLNGIICMFVRVRVSKYQCLSRCVCVCSCVFVLCLLRVAFYCAVLCRVVLCCTFVLCAVLCFAVSLRGPV